MKMIVIKKKMLMVSAMLLGIVLILGIAMACMQIPTLEDGAICVVIDAGHGGIDAGAVGRFSRVKESDLNLTIAKLVRARMRAADIRVVMTRETSDGLYGMPTNGFKRRDMQKRRQIIEESIPNLVISIHMNTTDLQSCSGAQVFYCSGSESGKMLAESIQKSMNENLEFKRDRKATAGDFFMLNCTEYTSVLVECGFISNKEEERLLSTAQYQERVAQYIYEGVRQYLGV